MGKSIIRRVKGKTRWCKFNQRRENKTGQSPSEISWKDVDQKEDGRTSCTVLSSLKRGEKSRNERVEGLTDETNTPKFIRSC